MAEVSIDTANSPEAREMEIRAWLSETLGGSNYTLEPASADASFRRYFRTTHEGESLIVMDAPPEREDSHPFVRVAGLLESAGLNAPRILSSDLDRGYLLLSDMGTVTYMQALQTAEPDRLMSDAIDALVKWQLASKPDILPSYDAALLQRELDLFVDWYVARHLGMGLNEAQRKSWNKVCELLVAHALAQPKVYVHRDYMPRNLMVSDPNPGILDFQDAVEGPIAYDVLSLFRDAFISWPSEKVEEWREIYWQRANAAGLPVGEPQDFKKAFDWIGLQRHLKVLGIFARIRYRDGKPHYLEDAPRFIGYIRDVLPDYPEMAGLGHLFDELGLVA